MRIVCPNCASQYEVAQDAIPEAGRDVQCAKCSEIWFQDRPMQLTPEQAPLTLDDAAPAPMEQPAPEPEPEPEYAPDSVEAAIHSAYARTESPAPEAPQMPAPESSEMSTVFRSLRAEKPQEPVQNDTPEQQPVAAQPAPQPAPDANPEPVRERKPISPEIKSILQEEAEFAARAKTSVEDVDAGVNVDVDVDAQPDAPKFQEPVAPQPDAQDLARRMEQAVSEKEQLVRKQAEIDPNESVTLASAKSLRDILESEAIDPVEFPQTPKVDQPPAQAEVTKEPTLDQLGMKRPTPIIQPDAQETIVTPETKTVETPPKPVAPEPTAPTAKVEEPKVVPLSDKITPDTPNAEKPAINKLDTDKIVKSGKDIFDDIDELNPNLDIDDDAEDKEDDLIDFADDVPVEKASKFSVGFLSACILAVVATSIYMLAPIVSEAVPPTQGFLTAYQTQVDSGRMVLQDMYYQGGEPGFDNLFNNAKAMFNQ